MMEKTFNEISWLVGEPTYREDPAYSYSTLAKFERGGFSSIDTLFDKVSSPSLTFGSMVDTLLTDGQDAFDKRFFVASFPSITDTLASIAKQLYSLYGETCSTIYYIKNSDILDVINAAQYQTRWKDETRINDVASKCAEYYSQLLIAGDREIISMDDYQDCLNCIFALKESESTKDYFVQYGPWDNKEIYYQLKFKGNYEGINLRCMADLIIVDYDKKTVTPCDLKTSSHFEYEFPKSFLQWSYFIQAQLYWYIIRQNMDADPYFKDFKLENYRFIVINRKTLNPLVWEYPDTKAVTDIKYGNTTCRNWRNIVKELDYYIKNPSKNPITIVENKPNDIVKWLNQQQ